MCFSVCNEVHEIGDKFLACKLYFLASLGHEDTSAD